MTTEARVSSARYASIDGLRAVSAYMVLVHHASFDAGTTVNVGAGPLIGRLDIGVSVFFAISGFLLYRPMAERTISDQTQPSPRRFWRRRFWRIAPSYWLALATMTAIGAVSLPRPSEFVLHFTLTQIYSPESVLNGLTQAWSLATEVLFYALLPLLAAGLGRCVRGQTPGIRAARLLAVIGAMYLLTVPLRLAVERWVTIKAISQELWLTGQLNHFLIGMALAVISVWARSSAAVAATSRRLSRLSLLWAATAVTLFVVMATQLELSFGLTRASLWREFARNEVYGWIALCLLLPLALSPNERTAYHRVLGWRPVAYLGRISYGIYLWHILLLTDSGPSEWMPWAPLDGALARRVAVVTVVTVLLAAFNHRFVEEPLARRMSGASRPG